MHTAAIPTVPVVNSLHTLATNGESGFSPEQTDLVARYADAMRGLTHVEPAAAHILWMTARTAQVQATYIGGLRMEQPHRDATFATVLAACFPADFADAVRAITAPAAPPVDPTMARIADALEFLCFVAEAEARANVKPDSHAGRLLSRIAARHEK